MDGGSQIQEIDEDDDFFPYDDCISSARQMGNNGDGGGGATWRRRNLGYDKYRGDPGPADVVDYALYDDVDSTVAYAVQLAMKDKEERMVDNALERIRRAQTCGQKNVRLSKREVEALERKRLQTNGMLDPNRRTGRPMASPADRDMKPTDSPRNGAPGKSGLRPRGSSASQGKPLRKPGPADGSDIFSPWSAGHSVVVPPSKRPPASRTQSANTSPRSPRPPPYPTEHHMDGQYGYPVMPFPSAAYPRPLPDHPHWVAPWQVPYMGDPVQYAMPVPRDARARLPGRPGSYMSDHPAGYGDWPPSGMHGPFAPSVGPGTTTDGSRDEEPSDLDSDSDDSGDEVQMVDVTERKVPTSPSSPRATTRGDR
ncbi:hypothetical protein BDW42DRAFT_49018 [Aspergillus taichungensis]|uniref:Prenylated rab acceptor 1 n=1 Tax=Aspergillus taichungensis TaxID=482145 RepID=A0A2J5I2W8_9EURO|nr:hypothetical protein BDW42DRAFT_49018 [Aspergillus taichungensis]